MRKACLKLALAKKLVRQPPEQHPLVVLQLQRGVLEEGVLLQEQRQVRVVDGLEQPLGVLVVQLVLPLGELDEERLEEEREGGRQLQRVEVAEVDRQPRVRVLRPQLDVRVVAEGVEDALVSRPSSS